MYINSIHVAIFLIWFGSSEKSWTGNQLCNHYDHYASNLSNLDRPNITDVWYPAFLLHTDSTPPASFIVWSVCLYMLQKNPVEVGKHMNPGYSWMFLLPHICESKITKYSWMFCFFPVMVSCDRQLDPSWYDDEAPARHQTVITDPKFLEELRTVCQMWSLGLKKGSK